MTRATDRERPDPDELLRRVQQEEKKAQRGKLTVFLGAAPGVGKTFAMLLEAGQHAADGLDVAAGVVETHGRFETATLLAELERLPMRKLSYRGTEQEELDLDAALSRRPALILVDELAHTNIEGARHKKRWQDVDELLDAGIDVYTTLNVQHLESLNDVVAQVTGVRVRETVPDSVIDKADIVKLIDLPPDALLERMREGKVYLPAQASRAVEGFFKKGNLIALRELALRATAERVDAEMLAYKRAHGIEAIWGTSERLLVCISPSPYSQDLLRVGRRMASGLKAKWLAVNVDTPATLRLGSKDRAQLTQNLALAEQLGAETITLRGQRAAPEILRFARERNITKIVAGKPRRRTLRERFGVSFLDELIFESGDVDVYVTAGEAAEQTSAVPKAHPDKPAPQPAGYLTAALVTAGATFIAWLLFGRDDPADVVMTLLLGVVLVSMRFHFRVALLSGVLSVLAFDFFFIPPFHTFTVADLRHIITFGVMLLVAVVIAGLTQRVKDQVEFARRSERRTAVLHAMSRDLAAAQSATAVAAAGCAHIDAVLDARSAVFTRAASGDIVRHPGSTATDVSDRELGVVRWVWNNHRDAGCGTDTVPAAQGLYLPLTSSLGEGESIAVLGIYPDDDARFDDPEQRRLADALTTQLAMALERALFAEETQRARVAMEAEQLRSTLLSSVSHDLRTPLAVMKGAASTLVDDDATLDPETRCELSQTLLEEIEGLERLVRNLLDMTRLEAGGMRMRKEWQSIEEAVGGALHRVEARLVGRDVTVEVPMDLMAPVDAVLLEQLLINLLENAARHTAASVPIGIQAVRAGKEVIIEIADRGAGLPPGEEQKVFEKFHRGRAEHTAGVGLGLAICRAIADAHGGRMWAENREGGGASFKVALPLDLPAPASNPSETDAEAMSP